MHWKFKKLVKDDKAQTSFFDAVMFFILMLIASSFIFIFSNQAIHTQEVVSREDMIRYTDDTMEAILQSSINYTFYYDINGEKIEKPPGTTNINDLLVEELALLDDGIPKENFTHGYEKDIKNTIDNLVGYGYDYQFEASYTKKKGNYEILFSSGGDLSDREVVTSKLLFPMKIRNKSWDIEIRLSLARD
jgi:hypothetical protein